MKKGEYITVGKKMIGLCIAAFLVSQMAAAYNSNASADTSGRISRALSNGEINGLDCIGNSSNGLDCATTPDPGTPFAQVITSSSNVGIPIHPTPYIGIPFSPDFPVYEDPYAKCEINLSEKELANEEKLQKEIDAIYEQINALYEKINEKSSQMPQHYDQTCMTQVDRDNMKARCNLTDDDLAKMDRVQAELNALYEKLGGTDDEKIWEEINNKEEELRGISACIYGPIELMGSMKPGEPTELRYML
jgi:uncharacterized coiled-coil protein SlyX